MRLGWIVFTVAVIGISCADHPMLTVREELCWIRPANDEPDPSLSVAGKFAVVYRNATFEHGKYGSCELDGYSGIAKVQPLYHSAERYAENPDEIDTVVLIETRKGEFVDNAEVRQSISRKTETTVYAGKVTISLIDRQSGNIARRIAFTTQNFPKEVPQRRLKLVDGSRYEYVCEPTVEQVRENLDRILK